MKKFLNWVLVIATPFTGAWGVYELWQVSWGLGLCCVSWVGMAWIQWFEDAIGNE